METKNLSHKYRKKSNTRYPCYIVISELNLKFSYGPHAPDNFAVILLYSEKIFQTQ